MSCLQVISAIVAAQSGIIAGYVLGWTSTAQEKVLRGDLGSAITENQFSWVGALLALGAAVFCVPAGFLTNWTGRKWGLFVLSIPMIVGWVLILSATKVELMYCGRILQGASAGGYCVVAPLYIGEIAQKEIRGGLGSAFQLMITLGILLTYVSGTYLSVRWACIVGMAITAYCAFTFTIIPESPVYLLNKSREEDAIKSLKKLRSENYNITEEIQLIKSAETKNKEASGSLGTAMQRRSTIRALFIGLSLMFFQQLCGINAIIFYSNNIFELAKTNLKPDHATMIIGGVQVVATIIAILLVDAIGRRILLYASGSSMAIATAALAFYFFSMKDNQSYLAEIYWLPITSLCLFIIMFSVGFGPVPWLMMGELFASDVKSVAASIAATLNWLLAFVVSKTYVDLKTAIGAGPTFIIYTAISCLSTLFVVFFLVETNKKSLNEIQEELETTPYLTTDHAWLLSFG